MAEGGRELDSDEEFMSNIAEFQTLSNELVSLASDNDIGSKMGLEFVR